MDPREASALTREADDADLVRLIAAAPPGAARDAEAELYRRLAPRVRLYGLRHLRTEAAAADLTQQVLLLTLETVRAGRVREPARLTSFVLGTCRMVVRDLRRGSERREQLLEQFAQEIPVAGVCGPALDVDRLADCLQQLSERARSVVIMTFYAERATEEVAAELNLSPGNVRVIRHRALEQLRDCMTGEGRRA